MSEDNPGTDLNKIAAAMLPPNQIKPSALDLLNGISASLDDTVIGRLDVLEGKIESILLPDSNIPNTTNRKEAPPPNNPCSRIIKEATYIQDKIYFIRQKLDTLLGRIDL